MTIAERNQEHREKVAELEFLFPGGFCYVMSLQNHAANATFGNVVETSISNAARGLLARSHRIATAAEIEAFNVRSRARQCVFDETELRKRTGFNVVLSKK
jgi:hypothetical protein